MAHKIKILPENLCNKIAAGEVVERPASVVKELLENSLDAGATRILLDVEAGGRKLIRVVDDGLGMGRDDAFLCVERHATSKISSDEDLFNLNTLGFRGEALPSIASVSRVCLRTRSEEAEEGWEIHLEGGTVKRADAVGMPRGTTIEVRNLFFNTPARRKFLRRDETELGHVGDVFTRLALAHPQVHFRLTSNERVLTEVFRQNTLEERVASLLGRPLLREMQPLDCNAGEGLRLHGLLGRAEASRSTTGAIYTFINGRYIRDRVVQHGLLEGYRNLLMKGRYPVAVLFLEIDPLQVDVNVHPTKHEVRFREQSLVHDFIASAVREALRGAGESEPELQPQRLSVGMPQENIASDPFPRPSFSATESPSVSDRHRQSVQESLLSYGRTLDTARPDRSYQPAPGPFRVPEPVAAASAAEGFFSGLQLIGQYRQSYLLCQDGEDLLLIDQHAAHERIGFERLKAQAAKGRIEGQSLLFPLVLELDFREADLLQQHLGEMARLGFEIEPFGGRSFSVIAIPAVLAQADTARLVRDMVGEMVLVGKSALIEEALDEVLILMACHSVIRANQALTPAQIRALLRDLDGVDFNGHCPHGRPVFKRMSLGEIEKMFKRV